MLLTSNPKFEELSECDRWFLSLIRDIHFKNEYFRNSKEEWMIQDSKNGYVYFSYLRMWSVLEDKYNMNYTDIQNYIRIMMFTHFNWTVEIPNLTTTDLSKKMLKHLNWTVETHKYH